MRTENAIRPRTVLIMNPLEERSAPPFLGLRPGSAGCAMPLFLAGMRHSDRACGNCQCRTRKDAGAADESLNWALMARERRKRKAERQTNRELPVGRRTADTVANAGVQKHVLGCRLPDDAK